MGKVAVFKLFDFYIVIFILFIAAITILGVFAPYFDPRYHNTIPYIGLLLPLFLIINIINCIYSISTKRFALSSIVITTSIIGFYGVGYKLDNICISNKDNLGLGNIRIMTFNMGENNVGKENPNNIKEISHFIKTEDIDILCIQEYPTNQNVEDSLMASLNFMPFHAFTENGNNYLRVAIFSRFPIFNIKHFLFENSENSGIATDLSINNKIIRLICAHLQTTNYNQKQESSIWTISNTIYEAIIKMNLNRKLRAAQADFIKQEINSSIDSPIIFCGDMNDTPASYTYKQISSNLKDGFNECGQGLGYTYRGFFRLLRIDYILYSKHFTGICKSSA
ncbi:MAG: endonuclease/exonuclease/phosphatase family protein [Dysgonomonas sp.]